MSGEINIFDVPLQTGLCAKIACKGAQYLATDSEVTAVMKTVQLSKIALIKNGFAFKSSEYVDSGLPVVRIANVQKGQIVKSDPKYIEAERLEEFRDFLLFKDDILISLTGNVGRVGVVNHEHIPALLNQRVGCIRVNSDEVHIRYLFHFLNSDKFESDAVRSANGVAQLNLSSKWLEQYPIPLPSLAEQRRIADILDLAEALRAKRQEAIEKFNTLSQAIYVEMFGNPVLEKTRWPLIKFGDLGDCRLGKMLDKKKMTGVGTRKYLRNANVRWFDVDLSDLLEMDFTEKELTALKLQEGDILICEGGEPGRAAIWKGQIADCYFQKALHRLRLYDGIATPEYIVHLLWLYAKFGGFKDYITSATIAHLTGEKLDVLKIPLAPFDLQMKFSETINSLNSFSAKIKSSRVKLEELSRSLEQEFFGVVHEN